MYGTVDCCVINYACVLLASVRVCQYSLSPPSVASSGQNWMEVAYGTQSGRVVVVVRHPENIGQAPQVFQSYHVHTCAILRVVLGEKHLISGIYVYCPNLWASIALS